MTRRLLAVAALTLSAIAAVVGCQDYNFNPVGACIIQPGSRQVKLAAVTSADVLFVVDDSGSMDTKQQALAANFSNFIDALAAAQKDRVSRGLQAFEFHLAVTTSSVFRDYQLGPEPGFFTRFESQLTPGCTRGLAAPGGPYPQGDFVAYGSNAKVLHFTKDLNWASWGTASPDPAITSLVRQFVGTNTGGTWSGGNVEVGSCGSGEEQHLQAARLAAQKAVGGQQPGVQAGEFAHLGAKLVLVFVGDEDDCSNDPASPLLLTGNPGNDSCVGDKFLPAGQQKLWAAADFANAFAALVAPSGQSPTAARPYESLGAAFIVSAVRCADGSYAPADACRLRTGEVPVDGVGNVCPLNPPPTCAPPLPTGTPAFAAGVRFFQLADEIKGRGFDVVEGSVVENFGPILSAIADLVKAPTALRLPSQPAANDLVVVRILDSSGAERKVCTRAESDAERPTHGWWFMDCNDRQDPPGWVSTPTTCIYLNQRAADPANNCLANPGETYSAEYLGLLPQADPQDPVNHPGGCANPSDVPGSSQECADALGGVKESWSCYAPAGSTGRGTCICNRSTP